LQRLSVETSRIEALALSKITATKRPFGWQRVAPTRSGLIPKSKLGFEFLNENRLIRRSRTAFVIARTRELERTFLV
jgi:hypothetical protein